MIYVAHPYGNLSSNKKSVELIIKELALRNPGTTFVSPIHSFGFMYQTVSYEDGMKFCYELLRHCGSAIFCEGWEKSRGCKLEMEYCNKYGIKWRLL